MEALVGLWEERRDRGVGATRVFVGAMVLLREESGS